MHTSGILVFYCKNSFVSAREWVNSQPQISDFQMYSVINDNDGLN